MLELIMQRSTALGSDLRAADPQGIELIQSISFDELITVRITRPRNVKHHRLSFAVLQEVFKAQNYYATLDAMLDDFPGLADSEGVTEACKALTGLSSVQDAKA